MSAPIRTRTYSPAKLLCTLVLLLTAYFIPRGAQSNADSHLALTYSIVEHATLRIDLYAPYLLDKAEYCGTQSGTCNHFYIDKAPGLSLLMSAAYFPLHFVLWPALMPSSPSADRFLLRYLLTLLTISVCCAAFAALLWRFACNFVDSRAAMLLAIAYALGSMALPFSGLLFSHALCAALLFTAFILLYRHWRSASPYTPAALAGLLVGISTACEYPTAIIGLLLFLYAMLPDHAQAMPGTEAAQVPRAGERDGVGFMAARAVGHGRGRVVRRHVVVAAAFAVGAAIGCAPALIYNAAAFGNPLALGYAHLSDAYYAAGMSHGILGVELPSWQSIWGTSFSPFRGMFVLSPWLLLAVPGLWEMAKRGLKREALLCATVAVSYFLFQAGYVFWDGGASTGPRHYLPALPFLAFPVAFALCNRLMRRVAVLLVAYSVVVMLLVVATNPLFADPHFVSGVGDPLIDQTFHDVVHGVWQNNWANLFGLHGVAALLPLGIGVTLICRRIWLGLLVLP